MMSFFTKCQWQISTVVDGKNTKMEECDRKKVIQSDYQLSHMFQCVIDEVFWKHRQFREPVSLLTNGVFVNPKHTRYDDRHCSASHVFKNSLHMCERANTISPKRNVSLENLETFPPPPSTPFLRRIHKERELGWESEVATSERCQKHMTEDRRPIRGEIGCFQGSFKNIRFNRAVDIASKGRSVATSSGFVAHLPCPFDYYPICRKWGKGTVYKLIT
ncbi:hypothetical protein CEXT_398281 [Caerostris extrusa]|uniref:Uncharacterized protein n=1 Tax=Caerostris extrusa TaxID=172846 RepID=A0AAV4W817_CAEEX|nr:hypothetical protein CEXT_398281 [Caerostris extrusa]